VSGGVVWVTGLLDADRLPAESIAYTVQVVVRSGINFVIVKVVFGGSTLKQPRPSFCTQYHQVPESVEAFHANEMLVSELAVMSRLVGVVGAPPSAGGGGGGGGGGFFAGAAETATSVTARTSAAIAVRRTDMRSPPEWVVVTRRYGCYDGSGLERPATLSDVTSRSCRLPLARRGRVGLDAVQLRRTTHLVALHALRCASSAPLPSRRRAALPASRRPPI
jgi:hypothetical protein